MTISQDSIDALFGSEDQTGNQTAVAPAPVSQTPPPIAVNPPAIAPAPREVRRILGLEVPISVTLAHRFMSVESILEITVGSIIEFDIPFDAELLVQVANQTIAEGQAVKIGENFGLRISRICDVPTRIDALGGH